MSRTTKGPEAGATPFAEAHARLSAKMLSELLHEELLSPEALADGAYRLATERADYRFRARRTALDHWDVAIGSVTTGHGDPTHAVEMFLDLAPGLGIGADMLPLYTEELLGTLYALAHHAETKRKRPAAGTLATADFQEVESTMRDGHPCFIANAGRIGFSREDHARYAPESRATLHVGWLAARRAHLTTRCVAGLDYASHLEAEIGPQGRARADAILTERGHDPAAYELLPVHPWQWQRVLQVDYAEELAAGRLVWLFEGEDRYQPQQSIRTLFNRSRPERPYVKLALSIRNMGFVRGLSPGYMAVTPAINDWVGGLVRGDADLREMGFDILQETVTVGYRHPLFDDRTENCPERKMLSALWRESPETRLHPGERVMTMAALLHRDAEGQSVVGALIRESGHAAGAWLRRYLEAYLTPLLHCFYAHELAFMPHGENVLVVLRDHVPARMLVKDIGEETLVFGQTDRLPEPARRLYLECSDDVRLLHLTADVFDSFFRHLGALLEADGIITTGGFWGLVGDTIRRYQSQHPELSARFARFDLFRPKWQRLCLNRLQLKNARQMLELSAPVASFQYGTDLDNPLHSP
ncbi:MAG: IucA/IucC family protein [Myxococcota bacterium]